MSKKFGFDLLLEQVLGYVQAEFECLKDGSDMLGETPIEKLFYFALLMKTSFCQSEYTSLLVPKDEDQFNRLLNTSHSFESLIVRPQVQVGDWRVDFVISAMDWRGKAEPVPGSWRHLIVECDGHDFHERTKAQAARDRSRDRKIALQEGWHLFRFTGVELWRDPLGCAEQVTEWASQGWGS